MTAIANSEIDACQTVLVVCRELEKLQSAIKQLLAGWKDTLEYDCTRGTISPRLLSGAEMAANRAVTTQAKWGAHKREGGLYWATYKVQPCEFVSRCLLGLCM